MAHRIVLRSGLVGCIHCVAVLGMLITHEVRAQANGINLLFEYRKAEIKQDGASKLGFAYGLSFQHDFKDRVGMGVTASLVGEESRSFELLYDSKFFTSDNDDQTAFYVGSFIGFQKLKTSVYTGKEYEDVSRTQIPVGLQIGVRGGLPGYFGELKLKVGYCLASGSLGGVGNAEVSTEPLYLGLGIAYLGFGWGK